MKTKNKLMIKIKVNKCYSITWKIRTESLSQQIISTAHLAFKFAIFHHEEMQVIANSFGVLHPRNYIGVQKRAM